MFHNGPSSPRRLICHVVDRLDYGGLENGLVNLINWMPAGYEHAVLCLRGATRFSDRIRRDGVTLLDAKKRPGKDFGCYLRIHDLLRRLAPWLVHTRNFAAIETIPLAWLAGVRRFVHSEHGLDVREVGGKHPRYNALRRVSRLWVGRYVAVSADLARWLTMSIGIPESKISIVYSGVDVERFRRIPRARSVLPPNFASADSFIVGTAGRMVQIKDPLALVRGFIRFVRDDPVHAARARLVMIGDGVLRSQAEAELARADMRELAWMPGFRDDMATLYSCLDVFVLPSLREGISNTALEAMANGLPVIATRVGGNPEVVANGITGRLVASGNPDEVAAALRDYAINPGLAAMHGAAGRLRVEQLFSPTAMTAGFARVYDALA